MDFFSLERIQIISIIGSIAFLAATIELIRKKMIREAYAILWLAFGLIFLFFSIWKKGLDYLAILAGIFYPPALLFLFLILALILILMQFSVVISSQNQKIKQLAQELALLKNELLSKPKDENRNS